MKLDYWKCTKNETPTEDGKYLIILDEGGEVDELGHTVRKVGPSFELVEIVIDDDGVILNTKDQYVGWEWVLAYYGPLPDVNKVIT